MAQFNSNLDDEPLLDGSIPIAGVDVSKPPSAIDSTLAADAENRLSQLDGLNRPRPGIKRLQKTPANFDSIAHLGAGLFLYNDASNWFTYDSRAPSNAAAAGGPAYRSGDQVFGALADATYYLSSPGPVCGPTGGALWRYQAGAFGQVTLPSPYTLANYPTWAFSRLIYAYENNLVISDILDPESWNLTLQMLTLDPIKSDYIKGLCVWQNQSLAIFRNGSTWIAETGPNLAVVDWELNRASATVGCACHGTIVQCGVDVLFLSETGRGVYALSQMPTSNQQGVWTPISMPMKRYISRINWAAISCARATYWNDLYLLSVPLDGATFNNFMLIYSVTLNTWQGSWCFDYNGQDLGARDFARDRTNQDETVLLVGTSPDGTLSQFTYPEDRDYADHNIDGTSDPVESYLLTRAFTFQQDVNQIQPHSAKIQFLDSEEDVEVTVIADRTIELRRCESPTNNYLLELTIPRFPFDLDREGYYNLPISLMGSGICSELQLELEGSGNWTLYQIKCTAFEAMPLETI